jgi:hypothetical protein
VTATGWLRDPAGHAWVALSGTTTPRPSAPPSPCFGIRGSVAVLPAYALEHAEFPNVERLWALVAFTVVVSILVHGTSATLVTRRLDARREDEQSTATTAP